MRMSNRIMLKKHKDVKDFFRKNGNNINVIDQTYKELVEEKIVDVFGKENLHNVYKMIEDVVEDEKMVCFLSNERCLKRAKN